MNPKAAILGCFIGSVALITARDVLHPSSDWPLPAPPPYRYVGAGVAFGLLALVADTLSDRIAAVLAFGLMIGLAMQLATTYSSSSSVGGNVGGTAGGILGGGAGKSAKKSTKKPPSGVN